MAAVDRLSEPVSECEFDALVRASQAFEIVEWMGSLASPAPFSNAITWRPIWAHASP